MKVNSYRRPINILEASKTMHSTEKEDKYHPLTIIVLRGFMKMGRKKVGQWNGKRSVTNLFMKGTLTAMRNTQEKANWQIHKVRTMVNLWMDKDMDSEFTTIKLSWGTKDFMHTIKRKARVNYSTTITL